MAGPEGIRSFTPAWWPPTFFSKPATVLNPRT